VFVVVGWGYGHQGRVAAGCADGIRSADLLAVIAKVEPEAVIAKVEPEAVIGLADAFTRA
jgi:hypothetical protein